MSREFDQARCKMLTAWADDVQRMPLADAQAETAATLGAMRQILRVRGDLRLAVLEVLGQDACGPPVVSATSDPEQPT